MPGTIDDRGPSYISSHSADVILSDIRPIKLKIDALNCINVLLDEFLYNILSAARSLSTDKLRAGLLGVLPTSLGKEALLEAEVELRAYWDRTKQGKGGNAAIDDDSTTFNLQWAFELLRLKCEAYSTLNESDENQTAEARLVDRLGNTGIPPKPSLVAPAALYLTAILEAMCEHILSNVGRVASRDSSRNTATVNDVFVALCEDESIYGLFKTMNVYEQIEQLSQAPKPRRSKSFSRGDKLTRTSSIHQDHSSGKDSPTPPPATRISSDMMLSNANRSSFERAKSMKKFISGSRTSNDAGSINGHKKSESILSDETKNTWAAFNQTDQDDASLQEFDDLMRSDATMKVSLTPDRLKTMEVYKQEKEQRGNRRPAPFHLNSDDSSLPSRTNSRRPSLAQVDSITEADEESVSKSFGSPTPRQRQHSVASPPPPKVSSSATSRARSASASTPRVVRKSSKSNVTSSTASPPPALPVPSMQTREFRKEFNTDHFPSKTRKKQVNRESLDLDDVMAGSDADDDDEDAPTHPSTPSTPKRPVKGKFSGVSASTRELMDFLNEGPPGDHGAPPPMSKAGRELVDFLATSPPDSGFVSSPSIENGKKGSGRLQRMMSKLSLGSSEKGRVPQVQDDALFRGRNGPPTSYNSPVRPPLAMKTSNGSLSNGNFLALANRPIPPRPSQMLSPPSSPAEDQIPPSISRSRQASQPSSRRNQNTDQDDTTPDTLPSSSPLSERIPNGLGTTTSRSVLADTPKTIEEQALGSLSSKSVTVESSPNPDTVTTTPKKMSPKPAPTSIQTAQKTVPIETSNSVPGISVFDAQEMRRLASKATTPDECRLIMDMFLAKAGVLPESTDYEVPYPSPSSDAAENRFSTDASLEISLVELFLGSETINDQPAPRKKKYTSKKVPPVQNGMAIVTNNGDAVSDVSVKA